MKVGLMVSNTQSLNLGWSYHQTGVLPFSFWTTAGSNSPATSYTVSFDSMSMAPVSAIRIEPCWRPKTLAIALKRCAYSRDTSEYAVGGRSANRYNLGAKPTSRTANTNHDAARRHLTISGL